MQQRKLKGTLFIRPWFETYRWSASALNQPWLLDMLHREEAEQNRLEGRGKAQRWRQKHGEKKLRKSNKIRTQIKVGRAAFGNHIEYARSIL